MECSGRCPTPSLLRAPLWTLHMTEIFFHHVAGLPPAVWAQESVEFPPHMLCMKARRRQMGMRSWLRRGTRTPPFFWPSSGPHGGGGCSHRLRAQVLGGAVINFLLIPLKKNHQRRRTETARRWSCSADLLSKTDTTTAFKKTALGLGSSQFCRDFSSSVETPLPMSPSPPHRGESSDVPMHRSLASLKKTSAHVHATCTSHVPVPLLER